MSEPERALARLEADRNEVDTQIHHYTARLGSLLPVERAALSWLRRRRVDLTAQIEELQA